MKSRITPEFRKLLEQLPADVRQRAKEAYKLFITNPAHPSLRFKKMHNTDSTYSVRITEDYRALGVTSGDEIRWFWIGSHSRYNRQLNDR